LKIALIGQNGFVAKAFANYSKHDLKIFSSRDVLNSWDSLTLTKFATSFDIYIMSFGPNRFNLKNNSDKEIEELSTKLGHFNRGRIIYLSSADVYDLFNYQEMVFSEKSRLTLNNRYGLYKIKQEAIVQGNNNSVILRLPGIWGSKFDSSSVIYTMLKDAKDLKKVYISNKKINERNFINLKLLSRYIDFFIVSDINGIYNIASEYVYNLNDYGEILAKYYNARKVYVENLRPDKIVLSISKIKSICDFNEFDIPELNLKLITQNFL
jgi:nucleoside-diphosphate-sugar epimerase